MTTEVNTPTEKPSTTVEVLVQADTDAAFLRGDIIPPKTAVSVDIAQLSVAARKVLMGGKLGDGTFELRAYNSCFPHAPIDEPTTEKIVGILEKAAADLEKARVEKETKQLAEKQDYQRKLDLFLASAPEKGSIRITRGSLVSDSKNGDEENFFVTDGWLKDKWTKDVSFWGDKAADAHKAKYASLNQKIAESLSNEVKAFYAKQDERLALLEAAKEEDKKQKLIAASKRRLETGEYTEGFRCYNERRFGRPWGALVSLDSEERSITFNFVKNAFDGGDGEEGTVSVPCKPGDVIAVGQKDNRGNSSEKRLYRMEADGTMTELTKSEAVKYLRQKPKA